jgi:hypothetical protein
MPTFNYTIDLESPNTLKNALSAAGVVDADFNVVDDSSGGVLTGDQLISISTDLGTESQCDTAIVLATSGNFFANKSARIDAADLKSSQLMRLGVDDWSSSRVALTKADADQYFTDHEYFRNNPLKLTASTPYLIFTIAGGTSETILLADIDTLVQNSVDRIQYIYTSISNADGSLGQVQLTADILAAVDQAALDLIVDTRV